MPGVLDDHQPARRPPPATRLPPTASVSRVSMRSGYLGLGSNVGERRTHLEDAVSALPEHGVTVTASSSVYETEPVGEVLDQRQDLLSRCHR